MNIYYFNITYGCNSNCIFCYSHNTVHISQNHRAITFTQFKSYMEEKKVSSMDRIIINGGEPLLHPELMTMLHYLDEKDCEVLIYTNGRLLSKFNFSFLDDKFRFVVPIHGDSALHDRITQVPGSFTETQSGIDSLYQSNCRCDLKIILNEYIIQFHEEFERLLGQLSKLNFRGCYHLTQMADTRLSRANGCMSISWNDSAPLVAEFVDWSLDRGINVKVFDTCIRKVQQLEQSLLQVIASPIRVFFKDQSQYREIYLSRAIDESCQSCEYRAKCKSAVDEYHALLFTPSGVYDDLE